MRRISARSMCPVRRGWRRRRTSSRTPRPGPYRTTPRTGGGSRDTSRRPTPICTIRCSCRPASATTPTPRSASDISTPGIRAPASPGTSARRFMCQSSTSLTANSAWRTARAANSRRCTQRKMSIPRPHLPTSTRAPCRERPSTAWAASTRPARSAIPTSRPSACVSWRPASI